ncbi:MAG: hypothetical protein RL281_1276, partial [Pseudomonadota bacterium]
VKPKAVAASEGLKSKVMHSKDDF